MAHYIQTPSNDPGFESSAAQASALTRRLRLVVPSDPQSPAFHSSEADDDVEALAILLGLLTPMPTSSKGQ